MKSLINVDIKEGAQQKELGIGAHGDEFAGEWPLKGRQIEGDEQDRQKMKGKFLPCGEGIKRPLQGEEKEVAGRKGTERSEENTPKVKFWFLQY